jgi:hypothetical protein
MSGAAVSAVRASLNQYRDQPKSLPAYTEELERFLLWAVLVRGKPVSSPLADDWEEYKDFLKLPSPAFVGPRVSRTSERWRAFSSAPLSQESRRYATQAIRRPSRPSATCGTSPAIRGKR